MKIRKIKITNFRNIKNVDIEFGNINILTGRNSTGKTNITQLLTHCLNTNDKVRDYFGQNITTYGAGYKDTSIETTLSEINFYSQILKNDSMRLEIFAPSEFVYKHIISKKTLSSSKQSLGYKGIEYKTNAQEKLSFFSNVKDEIKNVDFVEINSKNIYQRTFAEENNNLIGGEGYVYFDMFKTITENSIINIDNSDSFSHCSANIYNFIVTKYSTDSYKDALERIKMKEKNFGRQNFNNASFINLLSDIQSNETVFEKYNEDLQYFTDGIIKSISINTDGAQGTKGEIFVSSPHGPREIEYISAGTSIILYFVTLLHWLNLDISNKSYKVPSIMIFDELDAGIHPSLISKFSELLRMISNKIQLFISSHSTLFIDNFEKKDVYLLKDIGSFNKKVVVTSNILSYKTIINELNDKEKSIFENTKNSELYINGDIDSIFPLTIE